MSSMLKSEVLQKLSTKNTHLQCNPSHPQHRGDRLHQLHPAKHIVKQEFARSLQRLTCFPRSPRLPSRPVNPSGPSTPLSPGGPVLPIAPISP